MAPENKHVWYSTFPAEIAKASIEDQEEERAIGWLARYGWRVPDAMRRDAMRLCKEAITKGDVPCPCIVGFACMFQRSEFQDMEKSGSLVKVWKGEVKTDLGFFYHFLFVLGLARSVPASHRKRIQELVQDYRAHHVVCSRTMAYGDDQILEDIIFYRHAAS